MPLRISATASRTTITAATVRALRSSQLRTPESTRLVLSRATRRNTRATASGSKDTSEKKSQSTTYWAAVGFVCEMAFSAIGMNAPGIRQRRAGSDDGDGRR